MVDVAKLGPVVMPPKGSPDAGNLQEEMNGLSLRLRLSEERFSDLRKRLQFVEQNMLAQYRKMGQSLRDFQSDVYEFKRGLKAVQDRIILLTQELQQKGSKEDVQFVRKYVELWDPLMFVTRKQAEKIAEEVSASRAGQRFI